MEKVKSWQPWIRSGPKDLLFILSPPFLALLMVMLFPQQFKQSNAMPVQYWVILIVMVDVAHVYSSLYRTYFNPAEFHRNRALFIFVPLLCYLAGLALHILDGLLFWRVLAYLAVFHFIRQQYGFMRIYSRMQIQNRFFRLIDNVAIYTATIYPLGYWHLSPHRNFNWFVDGDFLYAGSGQILPVLTVIYIVVIVTYILKEVFVSLQTRSFNIPKNLIMTGTYLSWYFGIVYYNGDMAFTTLNVISHGVPYMALVWFTEKRQYRTQKSGGNRLLKLTFSKYGLFCFAGLIILFAYLEEGLWDGLIWREHQSVFRFFQHLPNISSPVLLALFVPLLSLPQSTHYVLDGFIWRRKKQGPGGSL